MATAGSGDGRVNGATPKQHNANRKEGRDGRYIGNQGIIIKDSPLEHFQMPRDSKWRNDEVPIETNAHILVR